LNLRAAANTAALAARRLITEGKITAYKMSHKTMIDFNTVDAYHASLPTAEVRRASA
jgi:hypothetical protein